jgi:hypothetical protein
MMFACINACKVKYMVKFTFLGDIGES